MTATASSPIGRLSDRVRARPLAGLRAHPEVLGIIALAAVLNLWSLSRNDWANTFYAGAVRSMASSWHDFLFASLDKAGLMTVDKPPAALWVQALSVRVFGFHPLSILVPEALMGVLAAVLIYDTARRVFGRAAGVAAAVAMVLTPITVAMSRHNNPDELLILCCVAALWCAVRGLQDGRLRWIVWSGALVGLGFETKMAVALFVVPGIALAWLWVAPAGRGRRHALGQLLLGGLALLVVGGAWPLLVTLTPAADRPWISGTSDNSIWSLIVNYNGVGRVAGQSGGTSGGPGGGGGFGGGDPGLFRLLDSGLGGQAGWLIGFALVAGLGVLALTRLRRTDPRTGWLVAVGGAFLVSAAVFSDADGIFHPYYVSFLAPWVALLVGAGVGELLSGRRDGLVVGSLAIAAGALTEIVVAVNVGGIGWAIPVVVVGCAVAVLGLGFLGSARVRAALVAVAMCVLLAAPASWAVDTLGHATSSTFPAGGPASAAMGGFGGGGRAGGFGRGGAGGRAGFSGSGGAPMPPGMGSGSSSSGSGGFAPPGASGSGTTGGRTGGFAGPGSTGTRGGSAGSTGSTGSAGSARSTGSAGSAGSAGAGGGGMFGGDTTALTGASKYAAAHGGGTVAVESQASAAAAILNGETNVAGIGGFSGRESTVSAKWIAMEVRDGKLRWLLKESTTSGFPGGGTTGSFGGSTGAFGSSSSAGRSPSGGSSSSGTAPLGGSSSSGTSPFGHGSRSGGPGGMTDNRDGSEKAIALAEKVGTKVTFTYHGTTVTMYDLKGKAAAILAAAEKAGSTASGGTAV